MPESEYEAISASARFRRMEKDLYYGNGKPGLCTRQELSEAAVDRIEKTLDEFKKAVYWLLTLVLGAVILQVVNLVVKH